MADSSNEGLLKKRILGAPLGAAAVFFVVGILFWGAYNTAMEATNTMEFCVSCHEMEQAVYPEYQATVHYQNRSGVRAICSDCHVPRPWVHKFVRKIQATGEVWHWLLGTVENLEKFEAKRLTLAKRVWKAMKETDSRECRNCHSWPAMTDKRQKRRAWKQHQLAQEDGQTCIDCHKGIAHRPVEGLVEDEAELYDGKPSTAALPVVEDPGAEMARIVAAKSPAPMAAAGMAGMGGMSGMGVSGMSGMGMSGMAGMSGMTGMTAASTADSTGTNWASIPGFDVTLFFPGQASYEWVYKGSDHGGARAIKKMEDPCTECHEGEQALMGQKIVSGSKAEDPAFVIPGKRPGIVMNVKAAHDDANLYMRFQWPNTRSTLRRRPWKRSRNRSMNGLKSAYSTTNDRVSGWSAL